MHNQGVQPSLLPTPYLSSSGFAVLCHFCCIYDMKMPYMYLVAVRKGEAKPDDVAWPAGVHHGDVGPGGREQDQGRGRSPRQRRGIYQQCKMREVGREGWVTGVFCTRSFGSSLLVCQLCKIKEGWREGNYCVLQEVIL